MGTVPVVRELFDFQETNGVVERAGFGVMNILDAVPESFDR